jgi:hypothetical protein
MTCAHDFQARSFLSLGIFQAIFFPTRAWRNGRRARLRIWFRKDWRFKSSRAHHFFDFKKMTKPLTEVHCKPELPFITTPTLAQKLGTTTHISGLLIRAKRFGLDAEALERLAIQRGCAYYQQGEPLPPAKINEEQFSNEELAIALLNPALRYHPQTLRLGAAMLGAEGNDPEKLARLAKYELAESIVRYIAEAGQRFEPENDFWRRLLALLPVLPAPKSSVVPHPTRFVAMTGMTRRGIEKLTQWIRPCRAAA